MLPRVMVLLNEIYLPMKFYVDALHSFPLDKKSIIIQSETYIGLAFNKMITESNNLNSCTAIVHPHVHAKKHT